MKCVKKSHLLASLLLLWLSLLLCTDSPNLDLVELGVEAAVVDKMVCLIYFLAHGLFLQHISAL